MNLEKLDPYLTYFMKKYQIEDKIGFNRVKKYIILTPDTLKSPQIVVFLDCESDADLSDLEKYGITINQKKGKIRTASLYFENMKYLQTDRRIKSIRSSKYLSLQMDIAAVKVQLPKFVESNHLSGKGIIIGIIDSGIDPQHPAFKDRILKIWDQKSNGSGVSEGKYGVELSENSISIFKDINGHGTHVAGIAAGSDNVYSGIAPNSKLVIVNSDLHTANIADGIRYIFRIARELNCACVINLSLAGHTDAHDGTDDLSRIIDEESAPGQIICCAAGNQGEDPIHSKLYVSNKKTSVMRFRVPDVADKKTEFVAINAWYHGNDSCEVSILTPTGYRTPNQKIMPNNEPLEYASTDGKISIITPPPDYVNRDHNILVFIESHDSVSSVKNGEWHFEITGIDIANDGRIDAWILDPNENVFFVNESIDKSTKIGSPGCAHNAVTVGSYNTKIKWTDIDGIIQEKDFTIDTVSSFSNEGPLRDGYPKPDLIAPGAMIASAMSKDSAVIPKFKLNEHYRVMAGTSMATPIVSGMVALLLEKDKSLDPFRIKELFKRCSIIPNKDQGSYDIKWGYGLIDASKLIVI